MKLACRLDLAACAGVIVERSGTQPVVVDCLPAAPEVEPAMKLEPAISLHPEDVDIVAAVIGAGIL